MQKISYSEAESYILDLAQKFSGSRDVTIDAHVCRDLGIDREDALEFYEHIEQKFGKDLRPVTERGVDIPKTWLRKSRKEVVALDPMLKEILGLVTA